MGQEIVRQVDQKHVSNLDSEETLVMPDPPVEGDDIIDRIVNPNAFLRPDIIRSPAPLSITPDSRNGWWNIVPRGTVAEAYDSNITRASSNIEGDLYTVTDAGADFRLGADSSIFASTASYDYTTNLFDRYSRYDTFTHSISLNSRVGRSSLIFLPYFNARFRSVEGSEAAVNSGRQTYDFVMEGMKGQISITRQLYEAYDFSHLRVDYPKEFDENFEMYRFYQELNYRVDALAQQRGIENFRTYLWNEYRQTDSDIQRAIEENNAGAGCAFIWNKQLTTNVRAGWGEVTFDGDPGEGDKYSGVRYRVDTVYKPDVDSTIAFYAERVLFFTPNTVGNDTTELDLILARSFPISPRWIITPKFRVFHSQSNEDSTESVSFEPALSINYQLNKDWELYFSTQYRSTEFLDTSTGNVEVLQGIIGATAKF